MKMLVYEFPNIASYCGLRAHALLLVVNYLLLKTVTSSFQRRRLSFLSGEDKMFVVECLWIHVKASDYSLHCY